MKARPEYGSCWRKEERAWDSGETGVGAFSDVLELAHTGSWEQIMNISQLRIQWCHINSLKLAVVGEFIPQKLANTTNWDLFPSGIQLLNIYQHTTACDLKLQVICLPHIEHTMLTQGQDHNNRYPCSTWETGECWTQNSHWSMKVLISSQAHISVYPKSRIPLVRA